MLWVNFHRRGSIPYDGPVADATGTTADEWAVWRTFLVAHAQLSTEIDRRLRTAHGISQGEYGALNALREAPGRRLTVKRIADLLGWERSRVSHLLTRMEGRGLVTRQECPDDARATDVALTPLGTKTLMRAVRSHAADLRSMFFSQMTPEEAEVLRAVLTRVLDNLETVRDPGGPR